MKGFDTTRPVHDTEVRGRILDALAREWYETHKDGFRIVGGGAAGGLIFVDGKPYRVTDCNSYDVPECGDDGFIIEEILQWRG